MAQMKPIWIASVLLSVAPAAAAEAPAVDAEGVYAQHCASCHGGPRYGGYAPPLIPQSLAAKSDEELAAAIHLGLPSTQMLPFGELDAPSVVALVDFLRAPAGEIRWGVEDIEASRVDFAIEGGKIPATTSRERLILVVERGTGSISVLDGDSLRELDRYPVGRIHGGPKFDLDYRKIVAATRDGTLVDYDLVRGGLRSKVKVAVNTRNLAVSADGDFVAAANQLPQELVVLDGRLHPLASFPLAGQPSGVYQMPGAGSFVLTLRDVPRLLTLAYPELILREVELPEPFEDFAFIPGRNEILASSRSGSRILAYDLEENRIRASLATEGLPHLFSACFFSRDGALLAALNHIGSPRLTVIDVDSFEVRKEIPLKGMGSFARTHPGTPYIWVDTNTEEIQLIDKVSLSPVGTRVVPEAGKTAMHVEFTAGGDRAFVSVRHPEGAVVVYDSTTLEEIERLPYAMPIGKYNAHNKTRLLR
jgi:mono/diheme cytochrome c family protein/DNA-binding beta-propeller fold protein YncE